MVPYFAYGTTQKGFPHHRTLAALLGEPVGRFRTASSHAIVVPHRAACSNPGCSLVHRMAVLVPGIEPLRAEGDLLLITDEGLAAIDRLETAGPYVRDTVEVVSVAGAARCAAQAYFAREPARWRALAEAGRADTLASYPRHLAAASMPKRCCVRAPGHAPPHDVVDPLEGVA